MPGQLLMGVWDLSYYLVIDNELEPQTSNGDISEMI
jgi:hypothetical protein